MDVGPLNNDGDEREQADLRHQLWTRWGVEPNAYWYPLNGRDRPADTQFFDAEFFETELLLDALRKILKAHGVLTAWELREGSAVRVVGVQDLDPYYDGSEGYWTSATLDWLIYASHERTITISGAWLAPAIARILESYILPGS